MYDGIQAIFFDAVGTLIHPDPPAAVVYAEVGRRFGSRLTETAIAARFQAAWGLQEARDRELGYRTDESRETLRWRTIVASVLDDVTDSEACFRMLYEHFARADAWTCPRHVGAILEKLAQLRLGVASNYDHRLHGVVDGKPELRAVEKRVISSEVGWRKPAVEFLAAVIQAAAVPAARILFVGDDPVNDYRGAEIVGMQPLLFDPVGKWAALPYRKITCLEEMLSITVGN
jgi:putative hydrolase of the HAD superfamily